MGDGGPAAAEMLFSVLMLALRSVRRNMLRSFLTILGIVIGVSAVITMVTLGDGATQAIKTQISSLGTNLLMVSPGQRQPGGGGGGGGGVAQFTEADAAAIQSQIGGVAAVAPQGRASVTVVANGRNWVTSVTGSTNEWFDTGNWKLASGRIFEADEQRAGGSDDIYSSPETTIGGRLHELGFSKTIIERFFRPFFSGVFFDPTLSVSSRAFEFCLRAFAAGDTALPAAGMGAIPRQIADALPPGTIRTGARVKLIGQDGVMLESGEHVAGRVLVLATDGPSTAQLLGDKSIPAGRSTTCLYFAAKKAPIAKPLLVLAADGDGPINSLVVPSALSQHYAPAGESLICVNVTGLPEQSDAQLEMAVRTQLQGWFGEAVDGWQYLKTYRIANALPLQTPPVADPRNFNPRRAEWLYLCGEYGNAPTINWALYSGRRTAEAIAA